MGSQLASITVLILITSVVHYYVSYQASPLAPSFVTFFPVALAASALPLLALAALINALEARRRALHVAVETQRLRAELAESRLEAVTSQLQPHFLFNTLQSISTLIHRDPVAADAMLAKLSDLLRDVLRRSRHTLVPLDEELRMAGDYLELARMRFGERLRTSIDIEEGLRDAVVPVLLLQPLIENAIKHGVGRRASGGTVGISARARGGVLRVSVWDDGVGLNGTLRRDRESEGEGEREGEGDGEGTGLANTRERLRHAFGDDQKLELSARQGGGTEVTVHVPLRRSGLER
jgi:sensor histidine kinase YesM